MDLCELYNEFKKTYLINIKISRVVALSDYNLPSSIIKMKTFVKV